MPKVLAAGLFGIPLRSYLELRRNFGEETPMHTPSKSKLSLIAISLLCLAVVPIGVSAAEKKVIVKEPEKHKEVVVKERKEVVVVRPVRPWAKKPHYGQIVAGVTLGTIIGAAAVGVVPVAPAPNVCWYWTNPVKDKGYWDYC